MGRYVTFEQVRTRLVGKVRFTEDQADENEFFKGLAETLINEAEGQVELHLSPRYSNPFVTDNDLPFNKLPERPTLLILRTLCELQGCIRIIETAMGMGSAVDGDKYSKSLAKRYKEIVSELVMKKTDGGKESQGFMYPPLPGLKLNYMNGAADDGFMGAVIVASGSAAQGAATDQINHPSQSLWTGWPCDP